ncbi:MAG: hypothetical protein EXR69_07255 [Myxococcales bacterium]|nr:hypothetical protein [Myxococcales bacterium]
MPTLATPLSGDARRPRALLLAVALQLAPALTGALSLTACDGGAGPAPDPFAAPDEPGPYAVSATTLTWTDARGRDLVAEVWYPVAFDEDGAAPCAPHAYPDLPITGQACRDESPAAPPPEGFPVVAFSHGSGGIRFQSIFYTEALAQHGYVVVAPDHPSNTLLDFDESAFGSVSMRRPGDISAAVDELGRRSAGGSPSADGGHDVGAVDLSGLADTSRYGMSGHSFGGWTTLLVAGGQIDLEGLRAFCEEPANAEVDYDLCGIVDDLEGMTDADFDPPDPRAVAAIPMAPAGWYSFAPGAVGEEPNGLGLVPPTLLFGGTRDESESVEAEIQPLFDRLPDAALAVLQDAGHYSFSDICLIGDIQPECAEEADGYINLDDAHAIVNELAISWFGVVVRGDERFQPYLDRATDRWAELAWTP